MTKQVTLSIDGQQVTVPEGTLLVEAARKVGIAIPVFCYHPKMEPVGMCRQCLVEIGRPVVDRATGQVIREEDGRPKIQFGAKPETACTTVVSEGMVVLTSSEKARAAQKDILEFLLTSHPLDCPVCDKGGECPLQNLTLAYGPSESRFRYEEKHHAEKRVPLGDRIWLDRERCIQCARCIRFQEEIAGDPVLAFYQRGRDTDIVTFSDPPFDSIFSGNTTDICPVGALTTADFRFEARPWELKATASLCALCPVGCNIVLNTRREARSDGRLVIKRVMPRQNEQVNEIWICDRGRFDWHYVEDPARVQKPLIRRRGKLVEASWEEAVQAAASRLKAAAGKVTVLASGRLTNEDLFTLKQLADGLGGEALLYDSLPGGELTTRYGLPAGSNLGDLGTGTTILVAGADLYYQAPLWYLRLKAAAGRGANLILVHSQATRLDRFATKVARCQKGGVARKVKELANELTEADNLLIFFGNDGSRALAESCADLLRGREGRVNNGLVGVWPRANDQGAWELGFRPAANLAQALQGRVVYLAAADPAGDDPQLAEALKAADAVLVQELFLTATAQQAEVVFPAQAFSEREGSYTSGERRVQRFYPATPPLGESKADFAITAAVAAVIGLPLEGSSAARVMENMAAAIPAFAGISYPRLAEVTEQWPLVRRGDLYYSGTAYENTQGLGVHLGSPNRV